MTFPVGGSTTTIGIVGAGRLGTAIGRLVADAGYRLLVTDRPDAAHLELVVGSVLPEAQLVGLDEIAERADVVVLAVPMAAARGLDIEAFRGVVVDATNVWYDTDATTAHEVGTTATLAATHPRARIVKTFNHAAYADLLADARPVGAPGRRAFAVAGDDVDAVRVAAEVVDRAGFDPLPVPASDAHLLEPSGPVFGRRLERADLEAVLAGARAA
ncbi:NADPH-dependent F420 reductase [Georgenia sp. Z1344]|uniref:NADPH-dependent F420 reductase n=1 Tax=Georgenia sp. Z1344 TaxID=3416706 RepID=UPI003CE97B55